jgi:hypothetical protein
MARGFVGDISTIKSGAFDSNRLPVFRTTTTDHRRGGHGPLGMGVFSAPTQAPPPPSRRFDGDLTGGCLCGDIRYTVSGSLNPSTSSTSTSSPSSGGGGFRYTTHTCQCANCRKSSGSLVAHYIDIYPSETPIQWSMQGEGSLYHFESSRGVYREFCGRCGTAIAMRRDREEDEEEDGEGVLMLLAGTLDEQVLLPSVDRRGCGYEHLRSKNAVPVASSKKLCLEPFGGQFWCKNFIWRISDYIQVGPKWVEGESKSSRPIEGWQVEEWR